MIVESRDNDLIGDNKVLWFDNIVENLVLAAGPASPNCPQCGSAMRLRTVGPGRPRAGTQFWGCGNYPNCKGTMGYRAPSLTQPSQPTQPASPTQPAAPTAPVAPTAPQVQPQQPQGNPSANWYGQNVKKKPWVASNYLSDNKPAVVTPNPDGKTWTWMNADGQSGEMPTDQVKATFKSYRDDKNNLLQGFDAAALFKKMEELSGEYTNQEDDVAEEATQQPIDVSKLNEKRQKGILPIEKMSPEQQGIDKVFSDTNENIMIDALAGSGKTTMLRHLSSKYGGENQRWLYMVFNTKNKVEAKQKFPTEYVQVETTNGFLGRVLATASKKGAIPHTERIKTLEPKGKKLHKKDQVPSKTELLADGAGFVNLVRNFKMFPEGNIDSRINGRDQFTRDLIKRSLSQIRNVFGNAVIQLTGLCKSFAVDPRRQDLVQQIANVLDKYDVDHDCTELKERIGKYREPARSEVINGLRSALGYDFMNRSYRTECINATAWMLKESMPGASSQSFNYMGRSHNLGQFRDFDDDLWYTAIHADKMDWRNGLPKGYTHVLADEVQDFNECQKVALSHMHKRGSRVVAVGDPNQSIYRFRGADEGAFGNIAKMLGSQKHSLSLNFRSKPAIINFSNANTHVNNLKVGLKLPLENITQWLSSPKPEDAQYLQQAQQLLGGQLNPQTIKAAMDEGKLPWPPSMSGKATNQEKKYDDIFNELEAERKSGKTVQTSFIARTNAPLANAALRLLGQGLPFTIVGKDVAGDLIKHISLLCNAQIKGAPMSRISDASPLRDLVAKLHDYNDEQQNTHGNKSSKRGFLQDLKDTTAALEAAMGQFDAASSAPPPPPNDDDNYADFDSPAQQQPVAPQPAGSTVGGFKKWLQEKLGGYDLEGSEDDVLKYEKEVEDKNRVILTTAHKSKGLEFERVYVLRNDLFPHPRAKRQEDLKQEANGKYVTYTRAMDELHIVKLDGQPGYDK